MVSTIFHFHSRTLREMIGKFDLRMIFWEHMGWFNHQLSCPDIFFRVHEEERFVGVSKKKGVYPQNGWWKSWTTLFFSGWFGGKTPLFSETSKSSLEIFHSKHLWPVFALWIGWWRKVPPWGSEGNGDERILGSTFREKPFKDKNDGWSETSPCFFLQFQFNYFLEKSLSYLVFFCVFVAASCWVIMVLRCYGTSFPLFGVNLAAGRRTMSDAVEDGMDLSFGAIWCIHAKSTPAKGKPLFQPTFFL